jgi:putative peptidoglycan lipid II flippase
MAFGTMTSRVLGLVREMAFAAFFSRTITDAWTAAFRLPNLFRRLLGEGSLSVSFIPVFVEARLSDPEIEGQPSQRAQNLVNSFYTLLLVVLSILTALGIIFAEPVLNVLLDPKYHEVAGKLELTVRFARIMFGFIFLMSTYAYFMGILNALGKYALAAMAPTLFNMAMIVSTLLPAGLFPVEGDGLAWGVLAGGVLQTLILVPALISRGYFPRLSFHWNNPDIYRIFKSMAGGFIGLGLMQITTLVNMRFASELGEGAISYIYWADRLLELPLSLVSVSLGTALLPTLAAMWSRKEAQRMSETTHFYLRLNLFVAIPSALGLYFLARPIVELLFQRGRFTVEDTIATSTVVQIYALILVPTSCVRVLAPAYYAVKNTWFPAIVSGVSLIIHISIAPWLMKFHGLSGLNFSTFVSSGLNFLLLLGSYEHFVAHFQWRHLLKQTLKFLIPGFFMALSLLLYPFWRGLTGDRFVGHLISLVLTISLGAIIYLAVSTMLRLEENTATVERVYKKIARKLGR